MVQFHNAVKAFHQHPGEGIEGIQLMVHNLVIFKTEVVMFLQKVYEAGNIQFLGILRRFVIFLVYFLYNLLSHHFSLPSIKSVLVERGNWSKHIVWNLCMPYDSDVYISNKQIYNMFAFRLIFNIRARERRNHSQVVAPFSCRKSFKVFSRGN